MTDLQKKLERMVGKRILVIGDIILDQYYVGDAFRISPEAPVPVVKIGSCRTVPGGAANVALNCRALGADVTLLGQSTPEDWMLSSMLSQHKIDFHAGAVAEKLTTKSRIVAKGHHVCRFDIDVDCEPHVDYDEMLTLAKQCDAIVLSDYARGMICDRVIHMATGAAAECEIPIVFDPKSKPQRGKITLLKPNVSEAEQLLGVAKGTKTPPRLCADLMSTFNLESCIVTDGGEGMIVGYREKGKLNISHVIALEQEPVDVSGCGDTVAAVLALALASGEHILTAAQLASIAAAVSVSKHYTATVSPSEILERWKTRMISHANEAITSSIL